MLVNQKKSTNLLASLCILAVALILTLPAMVYGAINAHDILVHLNWSNYFSQQFWAGELYPRWLLNMNSGLGSPTFFFYPPIPYYFTSLFYYFGFGESPIWSQLILSAAFALIASGFTAYLWLKDITNAKSALIGSVIYMALPYHWAVDLYLRFSFTEYWAFVWMPLILYFSKKIVSGHKFAIPGFAISYALLIMTHLPTTLIFSIVPLGYILVLSERLQKITVSIRVFLAMAWGIGLSAIYLVPAMTTQNYVLLKEIANRPFFYYANNFLWRRYFIYPEFRVFIIYLSILLILMLGISCIAFTVTYKSSMKSLHRESIYWLFVAIASGFMTLPMSKPIWVLLPMLQTIQFPWRFHVLSTVAATAIITLGFYSFNKVSKGYPKKLLCLGMVLLFSILLSGIGMIYFNIEKLVFDSETLVKMGQDAPEYRPKWVSAEIFEQYLVPDLAKNLPQVEVTTGQGSVSTQKWQPRSIVLQTNVTSNAQLTLKQFYYPGWTARLKGESNWLPVEPSSREGLLRVKVPKGQHSVKVTLEAGIQERLGQVISSVSVLIVVLLILPFQLVRQRIVAKILTD